jgi:hypothetical protein
MSLKNHAFENLWYNKISKKPQRTASSSPGEFHPQALTDPYVNLSIHTAPASLPPGTSRFQAYAKRTRFLPVSWLPIACCELAHPLRSIPITETSSLLRDDPPPSCASILSPFVGLTYKVFSSHHIKGSQVPRRSLTQIHATFTPEAA